MIKINTFSKAKSFIKSPMQFYCNSINFGGN